MELSYSNMLYLILVGIICYSALLFLYTITNYLREKIFDSNTYLLNILILTEYILFGFVIYKVFNSSYQLNDDPYLGKLSISSVIFNAIIYKILIVIFFLITLTSFKLTKRTFKESAKSLVLHITLSTLVFIVLYQLNKYFFSTEKTIDGIKYYSDCKQKQINEIFISIIPTLIWLYFISKFKNNQTTIFKNLIYNLLPIVIFYLIFSFVTIKPFIIPDKEQYNFRLEHGAFG